MRFGLVLTEADPETAFNALRLTLYALGEGTRFGSSCPDAAWNSTGWRTHGST